MTILRVKNENHYSKMHNLIPKKKNITDEGWEENLNFDGRLNGYTE